MHGLLLSCNTSLSGEVRPSDSSMRLETLPNLWRYTTAHVSYSSLGVLCTVECFILGVPFYMITCSSASALKRRTFARHSGEYISVRLFLYDSKSHALTSLNFRLYWRNMTETTARHERLGCVYQHFTLTEARAPGTRTAFLTCVWPAG